VLLRDGCDFFDWEYRDVGIAKRFTIDNFGVWADGSLESRGIARIDESHFDAKLGQRVGELVIGSTI